MIMEGSKKESISGHHIKNCLAYTGFGKGVQPIRAEPVVMATKTMRSGRRSTDLQLAG